MAKKTSKPKPATVGEKIVMGVYGGPLHGIREYQSIDYANRRNLARRIDSAIKRAAKEAYDCGRVFEYNMHVGNWKAVRRAKELAVQMSTKTGVKK